MKNLKILRKNMQKTQEEVANEIGINSSTYARYEIGSTEPTFDVVLKLADYFGCSVDYLLGRRRPQSEQKEELLSQIFQLSDSDCEKVSSFIKGMKSK